MSIIIFSPELWGVLRKIVGDSEIRRKQIGGYDSCTVKGVREHLWGN